MTRFLLAFAAAILFVSCLHAQVIVRGPYLQRGSHHEIVIRWRTDVPTDSQVLYGTSQAALSQAAVDLAQTIDHEVTVTGLQPNTRYWYAVGSTSALVSSGADHTFRTAPVPGSSEPFRAWVIGDSGTGDANAALVRDAFHDYTGARGADLWLMLGDNAYYTGTDLEYQNAVFDMYPQMLRQASVWPTLGNHDAMMTTTATGAATGVYYDVFSLPTLGEAGGLPTGHEGFYSFDWGNAHFICLNSSQGDLAFANAWLAWLQADLASTTQEWVVAYWHHPPYSKGSHDSDGDFIQIWFRQNVVPVLESYGVDLVLCGHSHSYERSVLLDGHYGYSTTYVASQHAVDAGDGRQHGTGAYRKASHGVAPHEGAVYVVAGCSGLVSLAQLGHPVMVVEQITLGSVILDFNGSQLDLTFLDARGTDQDRLTMVKGGVTPTRFHDELVGDGGPWLYDDSGLDPGPGWAQPGYDDSGWNVGPAPLGHGINFTATPITATPGTAYFRTTFDFDGDPAALTALRLAVDHDDGFVVHLNGTEIARSASMPAGPVTHTTLAATHEPGIFESSHLLASAGALVSGTNVLAVSVHQDGDPTSDLWFDLRLEAESFTPWLSPAALGAVVDGNGIPVDLVTVNGSAGGIGRSVDVTVGTSIDIDVTAPPGGPNAVPLLLWADLGSSNTAPAYPIPGGGGALCFSPVSPTALLVVNSYEPALLPSTTTPVSFTQLGGLPFPVELVLQGVVVDTPTTVKATNGVRVNVIP